MLVDPPFARWVTAGEGQPVPGAEGTTTAERFAAWERTVHERTNGWRGPGGALSLGWPQALGTPPWGMKHELEHGASRTGTRYRMLSVRAHSQESLRARYRRLLDLVVEGEPAVLYVGNRLLPRHVVLVLPGDRPDTLVVYEPASGTVQPLEQEAFVHRRLSLGGWSVPWILVQPTGHRRVAARATVKSAWALPSLPREASPEMFREAPSISSSP